MKFIRDDLHRRGIRHLLDHDRAALFAKMGKGKTVIALSAFDALRVMGEVRCMLVVAPRRVADLTWSEEVEKFDHLSHLKVANLRTKAGWKMIGKADICTINYEALPKISAYLKDHPHAFDVIVFDEMTKVKNPKGKRAKELRRHIQMINRRWGLTGTPKPNSSMELFGQMLMLDDGKRLGVSYDHFKRTYFYPTDYMEYEWEPFEGAEEKIYSRIADISLVLMNKDDNDAPDPVIHDVPVHLPTEARAHYDTLEQEMVLILEQGAAVAQSAGVLVNKMLQVTGGAVYKTVDGAPSREVLHIHDAKINALRHIFDNKKHHPMLIACNYQHEQERILKAFPLARAWPKDDRAQKQFLADWSAKKIPAIVANPASIGHGLNLQAGGHHIVWFSVPWSRELYDQLIARLVRRGQTEVTQVYRLLCPDTIDDAVAETLRKRDLGQRALLDTLHNYRRMIQLT